MGPQKAYNGSAVSLLPVMGKESGQGDRIPVIPPRSALPGGLLFAGIGARGSSPEYKAR